MFNPMSLAGRRILVTGASSGIGAACAQTLADLGAAVVLVARRQEALEKIRAGLPEAARHAAFCCDLGETASIPALMARVRQGGRLDGLVHAAGTLPRAPLGVFSAAEAESTLAVNYLAFLALMQHATRPDARHPGFSAVAVSSVSAQAGWPGGSVYCGSKGALSASVRALAMELAPKGIRVNAVCPSNIKTPLHDPAASGLPEEAFYRRLSADQPLGLGEPRHVAQAVAFLLSDAAAFITGVNLPVDGGFLAH